MNKKTFLTTIITATSLFITSCSSDTDIENNGGKQTTETINLNKDYAQLFPTNALPEGRAFINQLLELNNRVDRTSLFQDDYDRLTNKTIQLTTGEVTIKDWIANSSDLFKAHPQLKNKAKEQFSKSIEDLIRLKKQMIQKSQRASEGNYGDIGSRFPQDPSRYVDANGVEIAEVVEKQILGVILLDQILNEHLSDRIMQNSDLMAKNTKRQLMKGKQFTELEYHWDLAYALMGLENRDSQPKFIANYLIKEFQGAEFLKGADKKVFNAFKKGRKALGKGDYESVKKQVEIIRDLLSKLYATRCVHYLKQAKVNLLKPKSSGEYVNAFHPLSEAYGFIYAFIATRKANGDYYIQDYSEIEEMAQQLIGDNGFWAQDRLLGNRNQVGTLDAIANKIGGIFNFSPKEIN